VQRWRELERHGRRDGARVAIVSLWDVENNAVRLLAAVARAAGHHAVEIYFKDWISNDLRPANATQLENLTRILRRENVNLVCLSVRASAYAESARVLTEHIHESLDLPVIWGGMHPTMAGSRCGAADALVQGEGELSFRDVLDRIARGESIDDVPNLAFPSDGKLRRNALRPLVENLDSLPFRDYTTDAHKYFVWGPTYVQGDPMRGDPVYQMMASRGCIYKCSFCYNSTYKKTLYPGQGWYRTRSPESVMDEIDAARGYWPMKRIRFDDEVFNPNRGWLERFADLYARRVGLPFEIFIEPKLVERDKMARLRDAGLVTVTMGVQSNDRVTGHLYDRRVPNTTITEVADVFHSLGILPHFQLIYDDPVSTEDDKRNVFDTVASFPHPFDLYLFSMTVFPGSELDEKLHAAGRASDFDVEGLNTRVFYQHRVNLKYPRPVEDTFWIALTQMLSKEFVPRGALKRLAESNTLKRHPWPLIQAANAANVVKLGATCARMVKDGEMTGTLLRRWLSADRMITT
jgi:anaerobic magnesium-protoporphyrin IX monomethyl ester cyclase